LAKGSTTIDRRGATGDWLICMAGCTLAAGKSEIVSGPGRGDGDQEDGQDTRQWGDIHYTH
jgi:hypothetical protein